MSADLLPLVSRVAERARRGEEVEAFATHERDFSVKAYRAEVETLTSAEPRGIGVRVVSGGRAGFAYSTDLTTSGLDDLLRSARDNARHSTPDEAVGLAAAWTTDPPEVPGLVDAGQAGLAAADKVAFAVALDEETRGADRRVRAVEESVYSDSDTTVAIATSTGIAATYRRTDAWCYSIAIAEDSGDTEVGFEFDLARGLAGLDRDRVAREAAARAVRVLGARKIPSARMPVIFDPYTGGQFLGVLAAALTGEAVQKGRSLFAGRTGDAVAAGNVSLIDDGSLEGAPGAAPWDAEGVPAGRTKVIRAGVLESFLYDVSSARREGRESTGNAARAGFKSPPGPSATNLAFEPTGGGRADVLAQADRALLVQDFHGVHSGANPISGDFSVGATGRLLRRGEAGEAVKEITIAAPLLEILAGIIAVADDRRWLPFGGSFGGATTLVAEMTVAGE